MTQAPTLQRRQAAANAAAPRFPSSIAGWRLRRCYARCLEQPTGVLALALRRGADLAPPGSAEVEL